LRDRFPTTSKRPHRIGDVSLAIVRRRVVRSDPPIRMESVEFGHSRLRGNILPVGPWRYRSPGLLSDRHLDCSLHGLRIERVNTGLAQPPPLKAFCAHKAQVRESGDWLGILESGDVMHPIDVPRFQRLTERTLSMYAPVQRNMDVGDRLHNDLVNQPAEHSQTCTTMESARDNHTCLPLAFEKLLDLR
jgi:hypothetical protein